MIKRPNFICIGAAKAGTTTLYDVLKDHSQIYLPHIKETHFFDDPQYWDRGAEWYFNEYFSKVKDQPLIGEITPSYVYFPDVPERIFSTLGPDVKIILMIRNPVDRAISHYKMHHSRGNENLSFSEAAEAEKSRLEQTYLEQSRYSYMSRGYYSEQIENFLKYFSKEQIHVMVFEEIFQDKKESYTKVLEFLGVDFEELNWDRQSNFSAVPRSKIINHIVHRSKLAQVLGKTFLSAKWRKKIKMAMAMGNLKKGKVSIDIDMSYEEIYQKYFTGEIEKLEQLLDRSFDIWKRPKFKSS